MTSRNHVRGEIRGFLTTRRAGIAPEQAGLTAYGRDRRVPGLRREEALDLLAGWASGPADMPIVTPDHDAWARHALFGSTSKENTRAHPAPAADRQGPGGLVHRRRLD